MLLSGLKRYPVELSAIVSMADDGGSTGVLRDELGVLPPGDVRQCLVALSDSSEKLRELMNYRFEEGGLSGHSFGNLFLSALEKIEGGFIEGVSEAAKILNVKGTVIPVTGTDTGLKMALNNGHILSGEHEINMDATLGEVGVERIFLEPHAQANPEALEKIAGADLIVIGPGNHYCSIIPNLLVDGVSQAIRESSATVVYNCNLVNKPGHTDGYTLDEYVDELEHFIGAQCIDYVTFNTRMPSKALLERYNRERGELVSFYPEARKNRQYRVVRADFLSRKSVVYGKSDHISNLRSYIRHDTDKLAKVLMMLLEIGEYESILNDIV